MKVLTMPKPERKTTLFVVLLDNGRTIEINAESYEFVVDADETPLIYRFLKGRKPVADVEGARVRLVIDSEAADVEQAIEAIQFKKRNRRRAQ
ncbi:hypothetical protein EBR25_12325 [bacterium]|nr:hypothetical protein [bacterium]